MARWRKGSKEAKEALEAIYTLNTHMDKMVRLHSDPTLLPVWPAYLPDSGRMRAWLPEG